jgi:hypothetical protein
MSTATAERKVPKKALQFDAALQFADGSSGESSVYPISMLGRSAEPIYHWYWGKVVHDMAGFSTDHPRVAIDYRHDDDQPIGYLDQFRADHSGLHLSGRLVSLDPTNPSDRVSQLKKLADAGVPFQSSIFFEASKLEQVHDGASAQVNGYTIEGPAIIIRQWSLRGMAVCLYGADGRTTSQFSDSGSDVSIPCITSKAMTKKLTSKAAASAAAKKLSTKPPKNGKLPPAANKFAGKDKQADDSEEMEEHDEEETEDESDETAEDEPTDETPADDSDDSSEGETDVEAETEDDEENEQADDETKAKKHSAKTRSELKKYIEAFGHKNGATWFAEGLEFTAAMGKHCQELSAQLADKDAEIADLRKKLKAVDRGEQEPLKLSSGDRSSSETQKKVSHLGEGVAKFAAGLRLPGSK